MYNKNIIKSTVLTLAFASFEIERRKMYKSNGFMAKIYENRISDGKKGSGTSIGQHYFDCLGRMYFKGEGTDENVNKLLYGLMTLIGRKRLNEYLEKCAQDLMDSI